MLAGSILLAASAHVKVPFWPVPMTMQTFVVLVIGAAYGWRLGAATLIAYLAEGAAGLPVFTGGVRPLLWPVRPAVIWSGSLRLRSLRAGWPSAA